MRSRQFCAAVLIASLVQVAGAQQGPPPQGPPGGRPGGAAGTRIAGTVKSVTADQVVLKTAKGDVVLAITAQTRVTTNRKVSASQIKPGTYLGTSNQNGSAADTGTATEVHLGDNGPNVNFPMNNSGLIMTNGHVKSVTPTAKGEEMDIDYGQATLRHVVVPSGTRISKMVNIGVGGLKRGVSVNAMATAGPDGKQVANMIVLGAPDARPAP